MRHTSFVVASLAVLSACDATGPTSPSARAAAPPIAAPILNLSLLPPKYVIGTHAAALVANVLGLSAKAGEAGPTGPGGGAESNSAIVITLPKVLSTSVLNGEVWANQFHSFAASSVDKLSLDLLGLQLSASVLAAKSSSGCGATPAGGSSIASLVINGKAIVITGAPNQTINLLVGKVVINEQQPFYNGIRVRALHVVVLGVADVIVAEAASPLFTC